MTPEAFQRFAQIVEAMTPGPWEFGDGKIWETDDLIAPTVIEEWPQDVLDPDMDPFHAKKVGNTLDWDDADADGIEMLRNAAPALVKLVLATFPRHYGLRHRNCPQCAALDELTAAIEATS